MPSRSSRPGRRPGFTLVELLITIGIIGVLASVVVMAVSPKKALLAARDAERAVTAKQLQNAAFQYQIGNGGELPAADLIPEGEENAVQICALGVTNPECVNLDVLVPDYLHAIPRDIAEPCADYTGYRIHQRQGSAAVTALHTGKMPGDEVTVTPGCGTGSESSGSSSSAAAWVPSVAATCGIATGYNETSGYVAAGKLYVSGAHHLVSVIEPGADAVARVVAGVWGNQLFHMAAAGTKLYALADTPDASGVGHIGVIDTATDTVSAQITTSRPWAFDAVIVGSKLYAVDIDTVQVIDTASNAVLSSVSVGSTVARQSIATIDNDRQIVAVGSKVYVINQDNDRVKVIDTATDTVAATITFGANTGVSNLLAVGTKVYVSNYTANTVSVIDTATDSVTATVPVGTRPRYMNVSGTKVYVANSTAGTVSVINTATDTVSSTVTVGSFPRHVDVINGAVFIPNYSSNTVSVIDPATDTVASTLTVGLGGPMEVLAIGSKGYVVTWNGVECH